MIQKNRFFLRRPFEYQYSRRTLFIILVNVLIFFSRYLFPDLYYYIYKLCGMNPQNVFYGHMYWEFVTYMFLHSNPSHLLYNMLGLLVFGLSVERKIGSREFTLFYFFCGIFSGLLSFAVYYLTGQMNVLLIGASGAIYAVLFAYAVFFPRSIIMIWGLIPVPAPILVIIYILIELFSQLRGGSNIAHMTHLFGFLGAWLYFVLRMGIHPVKIWKQSYKR